MIPSYVTGKPNGTEQGVLMAADLGATHFRVCSVQLNGDHTFNIEQMKSKIPEELLYDENVTNDELFSFLGRRTRAFIRKHHPEVLKNKALNLNQDPDAPIGDDEDSINNNTLDVLKMGFSFSYPVDQKSIGSGTLIRWTKGFKIEDTIGKDVVKSFQDQLDAHGLDMIRVVALTNDTVGTFLAHCYTSGDAETMTGEVSDPVIGGIFGTGTNGCYMEDLDNIKKLTDEEKAKFKQHGKTKMVINTEWGSFDNDLLHLPVTQYDIDIDEKFSSNPGFHLFEKRVSAMFLGEILRNTLVDLHQRRLILTQYKTHDQLPHRLKTPFELATEVLSLSLIHI